MIALIHQNPFVFTGIAIALYWIFNAFVAGMPEPLPTASTGYRWLYTSLHLLAANIDKFAVQKGIPGATATTSTLNVTTVTTPAKTGVEDAPK